MGKERILSLSSKIETGSLMIHLASAAMTTSLLPFNYCPGTFGNAWLVEA